MGSLCESKVRALDTWIVIGSFISPVFYHLFLKRENKKENKSTQWYLIVGCMRKQIEYKHATGNHHDTHAR